MKKNNKGFSLVELIVVVLILGILAVAVSPQVMKWVDKSKISTDKDNANALKASVQTALAEWQGEGGTIGTADYTANITSKQLTDVSDSWGNNTIKNKAIAAYIAEVTAGSYPDAQYKKYTTPAGVSFQITIYGSNSGKTGAVEVKCVALDEEASAGGATPTTAPASGS